jgi:hypothetical protein
LDASIEVKKPEMLECDTAEGSFDNIHEFQHGFTDATNVLKQEMIQRILLFSKWRNECRFPASTCRGNHTCDSWMHLFFMMDSLCRIELIFLLCFVFKVGSVQQLMYLLHFLTLNFHGL